MRIPLTLILLLVFSGTAGAVDSQLGGGGLGFRCDTLDATCKCKGASKGSDCKAMKKWCEGGRMSCGPSGCTCHYAQSARNQGIKDAPTIVAPMEKKTQQ
jgi:hypothetical protein